MSAADGFEGRGPTSNALLPNAADSGAAALVSADAEAANRAALPGCDLEARLASLRTTRDEPIDIDVVVDAHRRLVYSRVHEPARVLDDESIPWMRVLMTLHAAGIDVDALAESLRKSTSDTTADAQPLQPNVAQPQLEYRSSTLGCENSAPPEAREKTYSLPLEATELENLRQSGLFDATIRAAGLETWRGSEKIEAAVGWQISRMARISPKDPTCLTCDVELVGLSIPCVLPGETEPHAHRVRLRHPRAKRDKATNQYERDSRGRLKPIKYESPKGQPPPICFGPRTRASGGLRDRKQTLVMTEGEKKGLALEQCGYNVIALPGIDLAHDADARHAAVARGDYGDDAWRLRSEIRDHVLLADRELVIVLFDEWRSKENAYLAELAQRCASSATGGQLADVPQLKHPAREPRAAFRIAQMLRAEGVRTVLFASPPLGPEKGIDDVYVGAALRARGLTLDQHDLTLDCAETLDHEAGAAAVRAVIEPAVDPYQLHHDLQNATRAIRDRWDSEPITDIDHAIARLREREAERERMLREREAERERMLHEPAQRLHVVRFASPSSPPAREQIALSRSEDRPQISIQPGQAHESARMTEDLLARFSGRVYTMGGRVVRVRASGGRPSAHQRDIADAMPRFAVCDWQSAELAAEISRIADVRIWDEREGKFVPGQVPLTVTHVILGQSLSDRSSQLPALTGVTEMPMVLPDGRVLSTPGYDAATGIYYAPRHSDLEQIELGDPTLEDAKQGLATLLEVVHQIPFVAPHHRAAWIALVLSYFTQHAGAHPGPAYGISAPRRGTGKSLLAILASIIGTGSAPEKLTLHGRDDSELEKRLVALARKGARAINLDNLRGVLQSPMLEAAISDGMVDGRRLGHNETYRGPLRAVVTATGNRLTLGEDVERRIIPIDLDAGCEHPEDRTGFVREDLIAHVIDTLPQLTRAACTILRAHALAGRPRDAAAPMGDYPGWDAAVRQCVVWVSGIDPLAGRAEQRARTVEGDPRLALLRELHGLTRAGIGTGWRDGAGQIDRTWWTATDLSREIAPEPSGRERVDRWTELRGAYELLRSTSASRARDVYSVAALSAVLRSIGTAPVGDYVLRTHRPTRKGQTWWRVDMLADGTPGDEGSYV